MHYFAYGSNMSLARLRARVPSAVRLGCCTLDGHDLRFHKTSNDGSGKCDAYFTANRVDSIYGALFKIDPADKPALDRVEGLGYGYDKKQVTVFTASGAAVSATTYVATAIDHSLGPYTWYLNHVAIGASETGLPAEYIRRKIQLIEAFEDSDTERDARERAIHA